MISTTYLPPSVGPTVVDRPTPKASLPGRRRWGSSGGIDDHGTASKPFHLLMVTTHPNSTEEGAGDVVMVPIEFVDRRIFVGLAQVAKVDSWGLAIFLEAMHRIAARGGELVIIGMRENIRRIFEMAWLDQVFQICATREEALAGRECERVGGRSAKSPSESRRHLALSARKLNESTKSRTGVLPGNEVTTHGS